MKVGFIGAGKVGFSLGKLFTDAGVHVTGYFSQHIESAKEAAEFTNTEFFDSLEGLLRESDALFLTVPDGQITAVYEKLVSYGISDKIICHCSGAMSSREAFSDIASHSAFGYSLHPLFPVSDKLTSYKEMAGAFFCIEGDDRYLDMWQQLIKSIGPKVLTIESGDKIKYHMACATASNLVCAVIDQAVTLFKECGFTETESLNALAPLIESNISHIIHDGAEKALTGPVERADVTTVKKHLECLSERDNETDDNLYRAASLRCTELAERKHPERDYSKLKMIL